jgi:hypothetical protein
MHACMHAWSSAWWFRACTIEIGLTINKSRSPLQPLNKFSLFSHCWGRENKNVPSLLLNQGIHISQLINLGYHLSGVSFNFPRLFLFIKTMPRKDKLSEEAPYYNNMTGWIRNQRSCLLSRLLVWPLAFLALLWDASCPRAVNSALTDDSASKHIYR